MGSLGFLSGFKWTHQKMDYFIVTLKFVTVGQFVLNHSTDCSVNVV